MVMGSPTSFFDEGRKDWTVGPIPVQIEKGDFNRDGSMDLAILSVGATGYLAEEYGLTLHVLQNNGRGAFPLPYVVALRLPRAPVDPSAPDPHFAVGDFNGDEWPDLALLEPALSRLRLAVNSTGDVGAQPAFEESPIDLAMSPESRRIAAGDFSGDGKEDLIVASVAEDGGRLEILVSDGAGGVTPGGSALVESQPKCIVSARIDGDDALDVALGGGGWPGVARAFVLRGDGTGGLGDPYSVSVAGMPSEIAVGDLDGSGSPDLVLAHPDETLLSCVLVIGGPLPRGPFIRGDVNNDSGVDISDAVAILITLFLGGETDCREAMDVNDDFDVNITDPIYLLAHLFLGGSKPPAPFPEPAEDTARKTLGCAREAAGI